MEEKNDKDELNRSSDIFVEQMKQMQGNKGQRIKQAIRISMLAWQNLNQIKMKQDDNLPQAIQDQQDLTNTKCQQGRLDLKIVKKQTQQLSQKQKYHKALLQKYGLQGVLLKQAPGIFGTLEQRYCVLKQQRFIYKENKYPISKNAGILNFNLLSCQIEALQQGKQFVNFTIKVKNCDKKFIFKGQTPAQTTKWIRAIKLSIEQSKGWKQNYSYLAHYARFWRKDYISAKEFQQKAQTGDLLLFRGNKNTSMMQRAVTFDEFDHVGVVLLNAREQVLIFQANGGYGVGLCPWKKFIEKQWYRDQDLYQIFYSELFIEIQILNEHPNFFKNYRILLKIIQEKDTIFLQKIICFIEIQAHNIKSQPFFVAVSQLNCLKLQVYWIKINQVINTYRLLLLTAMSQSQIKMESMGFASQVIRKLQSFKTMINEVLQFKLMQISITRFLYYLLLNFCLNHLIICEISKDRQTKNSIRINNQEISIKDNQDLSEFQNVPFYDSSFTFGLLLSSIHTNSLFSPLLDNFISKLNYLSNHSLLIKNDNYFEFHYLIPLSNQWINSKQILQYKCNIIRHGIGDWLKYTRADAKLALVGVLAEVLVEADDYIICLFAFSNFSLNHYRYRFPSLFLVFFIQLFYVHAQHFLLYLSIDEFHEDYPLDLSTDAFAQHFHLYLSTDEFHELGQPYQPIDGFVCCARLYQSILEFHDLYHFYLSIGKLYLSLVYHYHHLCDAHSPFRHKPNLLQVYLQLHQQKQQQEEIMMRQFLEVIVQEHVRFHKLEVDQQRRSKLRNQIMQVLIFVQISYR